MNSPDHQAAEKTHPLSLRSRQSSSIQENNPLGKAVSAQLLLCSNFASHTPKSGLNPIADAAGNLFTLIGELKFIEISLPLSKLQTDLTAEMGLFYETVKNHGYSSEYAVVCRYVMCAMLDEILCHSIIGKEGKWNEYSLLEKFNQDLQHEEKFFTLMERITKEPALYIDLMELMYLCLSLDYKGRYRTAEHGQYQLEQITNSLYKHIRAYRGSFSKILSPTPLKTFKPIRSRWGNKVSLRSIFIVTACVILTILISLGYLMDVITNEPYKKVTESENAI